MEAAKDILAFWFEEAGPKHWYAKSDAFDAKIRSRFEQCAVDLARQCAQTPHPWEDNPDSTLALIIALDQFSRNMYRDTPAAFAWDPHAKDIAERMIEKGWDIKIDQNRRAFVYLPFMHAETMEDQNRCVDLIDQRIDDPGNLRHAEAHRALIERFGRFPHRNDILGRQSTSEEIKFLADGGYAP
jgi:uncharacterized protein (DUF924 family)